MNMVTERLLRDVISGIETTLGDLALFSCLTGSAIETVSGADWSDIDLVVVLHDEGDPARTLAARDRFTRFYIRLHCEHGQTPDLQWPGEVLYRRDLDDALRGATFGRATQSAEVPKLCANDQPYRYWVSMIATAVPLTGVPAFTSYADNCARLLATHAAAALATEDNEPGRYWLENWHIPVPSDADRTWRIARHARDIANVAPTQSILRPYEPVSPPLLERHAARWSRVAQGALRSFRLYQMGFRGL